MALNDESSNYHPVDVILLSRNDPDTGLRLFKSIEKHRLDITRVAFTGGRDPFDYLEAFNACLFLSANPADVTEALEKSVPAGLVFPTEFIDDDHGNERRIAFDFDGVLADDSAAVIFQLRRLAEFLHSESQNAGVPMPFGPLHRFFVEIAKLQERERARGAEQVPKRGRIRIAIVTTRGAPAHERVVTTLRTWDTQVDEAFVLGGIEKKEVLKAFKPHPFFDDQLAHVTDAASHVPCAHVPFGIANRMQPSASTATPIRRQPPGKAVAMKEKRTRACLVLCAGSRVNSNARTSYNQSPTVG